MKGYDAIVGGSLSPEQEEAEALDGRHEADARAEAVARLGLSYGHAVVLPACDETPEEVDAALAAVPASGPLGSATTIVVVNGRADSKPHVHAANAKLLSRLGGERVADDLRVAREGRVLVLDFAGDGRRPGERGGVGFARRVGASLACALRRSGLLRSRFFHNLDADARMSTDAFAASARYELDDRIDLLVYRPVYETDPSGDVVAQRVVHKSGLGYLLGLIWTRSPYAVEPGSALLAVSCEAYELVGGFLCSQAGEDSHLVNRILRQGYGLRISTPVRIRLRPSARTARGTGGLLRDTSERVERHGGDLRFGVSEYVWPCLGAFLDVLDEASLDRAAARWEASSRELENAVKRHGAVRLVQSPHVVFDFYATNAFVRDAAFDLRPRPLHEVLSEPPWRDAGVLASDDLEASVKKLEMLCTMRYSGPVGAPARGRGRLALPTRR